MAVVYSIGSETLKITPVLKTANIITILANVIIAYFAFFYNFCRANSKGHQAST